MTQMASTSKTPRPQDLETTRILVVCAALWAAGTFSAALLAQDERSVWDGVYTEAQAARGAALFDKYCAECHGGSGVGGGMAPALAGLAFTANYDGLTLGDLFDRNVKTMPPGKEGQMSGEQTADITAAMLKFNEFPAGQEELQGQSLALKAIKFLAQKP
jgi:mono/diheme cytochrome c family protein